MGGARALMVARCDDGGHNMALRPQVYHHRCVATPLDVLALIVLAAPGDAAVGKSSLLVRLTDQRFMTNPDPTVRAHAPGSRILTTDLYAAWCRVRLQVDRDTRTRQDRQTPMSVPSQRTPRQLTSDAFRLGYGRDRILSLDHALVLPWCCGVSARL